MTDLKPFNPNPVRPKLRVRFEDRGPFLDLDVTQSDLLLGLIETVDRICAQTNVTPSRRMQQAISNLVELKKLHRKD
jgi:hypothetical protein